MAVLGQHAGQGTPAERLGKTVAHTSPLWTLLVLDHRELYSQDSVLDPKDQQYSVTLHVLFLMSSRNHFGYIIDESMRHFRYILGESMRMRRLLRRSAIISLWMESFSTSCTMLYMTGRGSARSCSSRAVRWRANGAITPKARAPAPNL